MIVLDAAQYYDGGLRLRFNSILGLLSQLKVAIPKRDHR